MHPILERHIAELRNAGLTVDTTNAPSGAVVLTVKDVQLPAGWDRDRTDIRFVAPNGYPFAAPDCFWADSGLTLAGGLPPQSTNVDQRTAEVTDAGVWFSWHVTQWNPNVDSLLTYYRLIRQRLQMAK